MDIREEISGIFNYVREMLSDSVQTLSEWEAEQVEQWHKTGVPHDDLEFSQKVAYHEVGHIATNWNKWPVVAVTNLQIGGRDHISNGVAYVDDKPKSDALDGVSDGDVKDLLVYSLGGQESEKIRYGDDVETGAGDIESFRVPTVPDPKSRQMMQSKQGVAV